MSGISDFSVSTCSGERHRARGGAGKHDRAFLIDHAARDARRLRRIFRRRVGDDQLELGAAERLDAALAIDLVDRDLQAPGRALPTSPSPPVSEFGAPITISASLRRGRSPASRPSPRRPSSPSVLLCA